MKRRAPQNTPCIYPLISRFKNSKMSLNFRRSLSFPQLVVKGHIGRVTLCRLPNVVEGNKLVPFRRNVLTIPLSSCWVAGLDDLYWFIADAFYPLLSGQNELTSFFRGFWLK